MTISMVVTSGPSMQLTENNLHSRKSIDMIFRTQENMYMLYTLNEMLFEKFAFPGGNSQK